jgi:hypothetical protein
MSLYLEVSALLKYFVWSPAAKEEKPLYTAMLANLWLSKSVRKVVFK